MREPLDSRDVVRCLVAVALCLSACGPGEQWQGTIEEIDGVTHVSNPAEPLWGTSAEDEPRLSLELEQVFGVDREPADAILGNEYALYADVDPQGNVYVLDGQAHQLVSFDPQGAVRWRAGRQGEGPGEFFRPGEIAVAPDGTIVVANQSRTRLSLWESNGTWRSDVGITDPPLELTDFRFPWLAGFAAPERLVVAGAMGGKTGSRVAVLDPFAPALVVQFEWDQLPEVQMPRNLASGARVLATADGTITMGSGAGYRFRIYDADGNLRRHVTRAVDYPVRSGFYEEEGARGMSSFGEVYAPMPVDADHLLVGVTWALDIDDPDALAIEAARAIRERTERPETNWRSSFDLYDREGRLLYSLVEEGTWETTGRPVLMGPDNRLYTIAGDPFPQIRRYRVEIR